MIITSAQQNDITKLAVTMFGAAPGGYKTFLDELYVANGGDMTATAAALSTQPAFGSIHSGTDVQIAQTIFDNLSLDAITDAVFAADALTYIQGQVTAGADLGGLYAFGLDYMANNPGFTEALAVLDTKVAIANAFTAGNGANVTDLDVLIAQMDGVTANTPVPAFASLTVEQDSVFGNAADNVIKAFLSADVNTLQSGDYINGGAGVDTLNVTLANAPFAIAPETVSIEKLYVQSQATGFGDGDNEANAFSNTIDAQFMSGTNEFWSTNSRADLVIEDVRNNSDETKIGWQAADPGDVDYTVYFSPTFITSPTAEAAGAQLFLELLDFEGAAKDPSQPLEQNPFIGVIIEIDGVDVSIVAPDPITTSYQDLVDGFNASLLVQGYDTVTASLGVPFSKFDANGNLQTGTTIVLTNTGPESLVAQGWTTGTGFQPANNNLHTAINDVPAAVDPYLTQTDIVLDWVGRGSNAGDFIAGNMSTGLNSDSQGIEQFNVEVDRDSWLDSMASTNNTLEVVNVVNIGANGSLQLNSLNDVRVFDASSMIGEVNLTANLSNNITEKYLNLTDTAADQNADDSEISYVGVVDTEFSYDLGNADDTLNLTIDSANLVSNGTLTREDFILEVNGGSGDDNVTLSVTDGLGLAATAGEWFANHEQYVDASSAVDKSNIMIKTGAGDDVVMTTGGGSFDIATGSGNDTIYTDNAGAKAQWLVNGTSALLGQDPTDIISTPLADQLLYKATLTVTFSGAATLAQGGVTGVAGVAVPLTNGFESSVTIPTFDYLGSQAEVNQAIKAAINNDAVLSKLLIAQDGPADTLIINSLVDGVFAPTDLSFDITAATLADLTPAEIVGLDSAWKTLNADSTLPAVADADLTAQAALLDPVEVATFAGTASTFENNNIIEAGTGDDVIVLSTDALSNETLVFDGAFGNDTVFNFNDNSAAAVLASPGGQDTLDFTAHLNNLVSASGSVESQVDAVTTQTTALSTATQTLNANDFAIITGTAFTVTDSWAAMTGADLLNAIVNTASVAYADITATTLDASTEANMVGTVSNSIVFVENTNNLGEYKVFELVANDSTLTPANEFTSATLLGSIDFGTSIDATTVVIA